MTLPPNPNPNLRRIAGLLRTSRLSIRAIATRDRYSLTNCTVIVVVITTFYSPWVPHRP
jgi:hypothetical protein